jgi:predicted MFS family arabinose efflux permease
MHRAAVVTAIGTGQLLAWGCSFYLPAVLAEPLARDVGVDVPTVFLAFSLAMGGSALVGPASGRAIDRWGGRPVLIASNLMFAAGLAALALAGGPVSMFVAWAAIGVAMGVGLYEAAFATVVRLYGTAAKDAITGITLFGGFASTVGWPLSAWMEARWGWRGACAGWALLHLAVALPLNAAVPRARPEGVVPDPHPAAPASEREPAGVADRAGPTVAAGRATFALLAFVFASTWFVTTAFAAHGPRMLQMAGTTAAVAVAVGALVGPAQVLGRLTQFWPLRRADPLKVAQAATLGHPAAVLVLLLGGPAFAPLFALLHGAGGGLMTISRGALPLALFGAVGYGARQGWLMAPTRIAQAVAPYVFGLMLERWGAGALWGTTALSVLAWLALRAVPSASARTSTSSTSSAPRP